MLNVLLLLPSLLFSVSTLLGPFLLQPRIGKPLGKSIVIPKILGWLAAFVFYTLVSLSLARGGWWGWAGFIFFCAVLTLLARPGLKFVFFRSRLNRAKKELSRLLLDAGVTAEESGKRSSRILQQALASGDSFRGELAELPPDKHAGIVQFIEEQLRPLLKEPVHGKQTGGTRTSQWKSEFGRSLALALLVLLWFFIVPVPGLLVFTAGAYRFSLGLRTIFLLVVGCIGFVLLAFWVGKFIQWVDRRGIRQRGLSARLEIAYRAFHSSLATPGKLAAPDVASTFALLTDAQTYLEQRSYAYARRSLNQIETILRARS